METSLQVLTKARRALGNWRFSTHWLSFTKFQYALPPTIMEAEDQRVLEDDETCLGDPQNVQFGS